MRLASAFQTLVCFGLAWAIAAMPATAQTQSQRGYAPGRGMQDTVVSSSGDQELIGHALLIAVSGPFIWTTVECSNGLTKHLAEI